MPELPEVETIVRQLNRAVSGKTILDLSILNQGSFLGDKSLVIGTSIKTVYRRAKVLVFGLSNGMFLMGHLKMTGQMVYQDKDIRLAGGHPSHDFHAKLPNNHTRVVIKFTDDSSLFFNDLRKFGWLRLVDKDELTNYLAKYGPDAVPLIDKKYLKSRAKKMPKSTVKKFILDQGVIAGIGNIYADESLFDAKIHPETLVSKLSNEDWNRLSSSITSKLNFAIKQGGTTDSDYVDAFGNSGGMQEYLNVYHKTGEACPNRCGGSVAKIRVAGRGTHYCPKCQKEQ